MKLVIAVIQPDKLADVKEALQEAGVGKMTASNVIGCGQQMGYEETYRGIKAEINLLKKVEVRVAINEEYLQKTTDAIIKGARTGNIGDGKIFILDLPECIRIRTGETGHDAIG
jgi:nitrogen regulatory protein P-II 1